MRLKLVMAAVALIAPVVSHAQEYPAKPVRLLIPWAGIKFE